MAADKTLGFVIRISSFVIPSSFVIRHSSLMSRSVIEDVMHRLAEATFGGGFSRDASPGAVWPAGVAATVLANHADADETGPLEEGIDLAHRRESFDPGHGTGF